MVSILIAGGMTPCSCGSVALIWSTVSMTLAPGCLNTTSTTAGLPLSHAAMVDVLGAIDGLADIAHADRRAVAIGDDDVVA